MISEISASSQLLVLVGSTNKVKAEAAKGAFRELLPKDVPETHLTVIGLDAAHGISNWRSTHAPGQPFGVEQTTFGAVNRMKECWKKATEYMQPARTHLFVVGFENGLVDGREIGKDP